MKYYKQVIPEKLDIKIKEIEKCPPKIPGFRMSFLKQIIYWICTKKEENGYSYLNMKYLRTQIPQAEQYIRFLLAEEIIERTNGYIPGERSYGYRIAIKYESKYIVTNVTDQKLIRKIEETPRKFAWGFSVQNKYIQDFTIDPQAIKFAENNYSGESYNSAIVSINMANNGEKYSLIDNAGGRFYSPLTNMPSGLRQFVRVKDRYLKANVDIRNSQPYFSIMILTNPKEVARFTKCKDLAMILKNLYVSDNYDIKLYIELVTNGKFYEYLIPYFEAKKLISTDLSPKEKRSSVKEQVMKILFDRNRPRLSRAKKIFRALFPTVSEIFSIVRGIFGGERFPILLQAIEAHVILKVIIPILNNRHPDIICFTVHDSILVTDNPEVVEGVMTEELTKYTGYSPILKTELFALNEFSPQSITNQSKGEGESGREESTGEAEYYYGSKTSVIN